MFHTMTSAFHPEGVETGGGGLCGQFWVLRGLLMFRHIRHKAYLRLAQRWSRHFQDLVNSRRWPILYINCTFTIISDYIRKNELRGLKTGKSYSKTTCDRPKLVAGQQSITMIYVFMNKHSEISRWRQSRQKIYDGAHLQLWIATSFKNANKIQ